MIKKTIIQLWGKQGSGKTGTIKIINEELIIKYNNPSHTYALPVPGGEISESLFVMDTRWDWKAWETICGLTGLINI
jgi:hypothetical protein